MIHIAQTAADLRRCFPVMVQLRPHLSEERFLEQAQRQMQSGYLVAFVEADDRVVAVAGFRLTELLHWGKAVYVDDLVTDKDARSSGHGGLLFDWLIDYANRHDCDSFHLDSGANPQRWDAHRFYLKKGMNITSLHFAKSLKQA